MRLIDADALVDILHAKSNMAVLRDTQRIFDHVAKSVEKMPTVDAVPVVRCKDCKHYKYRMCELIGNIMDGYYHGTFDVKRPDDFCSYGVKKGGGEVCADD